MPYSIYSQEKDFWIYHCRQLGYLDYVHVQWHPLKHYTTSLSSSLYMNNQYTHQNKAFVIREMKIQQWRSKNMWWGNKAEYGTSSLIQHFLYWNLYTYTFAIYGSRLELFVNADYYLDCALADALDLCCDQLKNKETWHLYWRPGGQVRFVNAYNDFSSNALTA